MKQVLANPTILKEIDVSAEDYEDGSGILFVGTEGNVVVDGLEGGTEITLMNIPSGSIIPFMIKKVYSTGTTATNLVMCY